MFNKSSQVSELKEKLSKTETVLESLQQLNEQLVEAIKQTTTLTNIDVCGNVNVFTLQRDGQEFKIETYHMMEDNVELWKQHAGLEE